MHISRLTLLSIFVLASYSFSKTPVRIQASSDTNISGRYSNMCSNDRNELLLHLFEVSPAALAGVKDVKLELVGDRILKIDFQGRSGESNTLSFEGQLKAGHFDIEFENKTTKMNILERVHAQRGIQISATNDILRIDTYQVNQGSLLGLFKASGTSNLGETYYFHRIE